MTYETVESNFIITILCIFFLTIIQYYYFFFFSLLQYAFFSFPAICIVNIRVFNRVLLISDIFVVTAIYKQNMCNVRLFSK